MTSLPARFADAKPAPNHTDLHVEPIVLPVSGLSIYADATCEITNSYRDGSRGMTANPDGDVVDGEVRKMCVTAVGDGDREYQFDALDPRDREAIESALFDEAYGFVEMER